MPPFFRSPRPARALGLSLFVVPLLMALACQVSAPSESEDALEPQSPRLVLEPGQLVVSITFDDARASQVNAAALLEARGLRGTFFVSSGRIGLSGYLTLDQLRRFQAAGHEVGGHTVSHVQLPTLDVDSQRRQVCDDRVALMNAGFRVTSFAYPSGARDATTEQVVIGCNYNSARESGGLRTPDSCSGCPYAETVPPQDPFAIRNHGSIQRTQTLADLQGLVLRAESAGGGWVPLAFHEICPGPCPTSETYGINVATFTAFLDWLAARSSRGTFVRTVDQVIGGAVKPPVNGPPLPDAGTPPPTQLLANPSLETDSNGDGTPDCWQRGGYGANSYTWSRTSDAHSGNWAQRLSITSYSSGDRKLISLEDLGACAPPLTTGHRYRVSAWYKATATPLFKAYYRNASGGWVWWAQSALLPTRGTYGYAEWTTPPAPSAGRALSVGLALERVGTLTMDDFRLEDLGPGAVAPLEPEPSPVP
ncbi:polysaccharide deacetylase family protein [Corallococcus coralloides]|uniref:polysaccharide deacetylase family protein n=1 Tax=Corallococcus coralloides TaxID=184914 RepID=UPI00384C32FA